MLPEKIEKLDRRFSHLEKFLKLRTEHETSIKTPTWHYHLAVICIIDRTLEFLSKFRTICERYHSHGISRILRSSTTRRCLSLAISPSSKIMFHFPLGKVELCYLANSIERAGLPALAEIGRPIVLTSFVRRGEGNTLLTGYKVIDGCFGKRNSALATETMILYGCKAFADALANGPVLGIGSKSCWFCATLRWTRNSVPDSR